MRLLDCHMADADGDPVVLVRGEVDLSTASELRACLDEAVIRASTRVVIDLSQLDYIDSAGLSVLVGALRRLQQHDADLVLRSPTAGTFRLLEIAGLAEHFHIEGNRAT